MEKKSSNGIIIFLVGIIIIILVVLCVLFATGKLVFKSDNNGNVNTEENSNTSETQNDKQHQTKKNYSNFIGTWHNDQTQNEITIKNITENEITFTWFVYRLASIDDDTIIAFKDGKGIFFYQGYYDKNFDGKETEDEKYIRKATIELNDNGVNVIVEDVNQIDANYKLLDNFSGSAYIKSGTYTHPNKYE